MYGWGLFHREILASVYDEPTVVYAGKAHQQTVKNVMNAIGERQSITQSALDKIVGIAAKKGSCTFTLDFRGSIIYAR